MPGVRLPSPLQVLTLAVALLIGKVTIGIVLNYHTYIPADFETGFLEGRKSYFHGIYSWAFYCHIVSGPFSLLLGILLISDRFQARYPEWHRYLGRLQIANVLLLLAPSGLWMARYAETGTVAGSGFAVLAIATGVSAVLGWRSAVARHLSRHRRWMSRCLVLLCSAVVLRLQAGLATVFEFDATWLYPLAAWTSWLVPLLVFESVTRLTSRRGRSRRTQSPAACP